MKCEWCVEDSCNWNNGCLWKLGDRVGAAEVSRSDEGPCLKHSSFNSEFCGSLPLSSTFLVQFIRLSRQ
jgi:hypothetical protein